MEQAGSERKEVEPTAEDREELMQSPMEGSTFFNGRQTFKKKRKESPRQKVFIDLKSIDNQVCGPPCKERHVAEQVLQLNKEFESLFPAKLPQGLSSVRKPITR